jgi:AAA15 family ATPase/GTPase
MLDLPVEIKLDYLWPGQIFRKKSWGNVNFLVGPNGTGKTRFIEHLRTNYLQSRYSTRYISTERLVGLERQNYNYFGGGGLTGFNIKRIQDYLSNAKDFGLTGDALILLRDKKDLRIKVESMLFHIFKRQFRFVDEGGIFTLKIQKDVLSEYDFREAESSGLKEIVTMLTFLYSEEYNCIILDEPELHLHPQFQQFIMQEIRRLAGDPNSESGKKCFFILTHSPYFVDLRSVEDLKNCILFQPDKLPHFIESLEEEDEKHILKFLPRLNTHH